MISCLFSSLVPDSNVYRFVCRRTLQKKWEMSIQVLETLASATGIFFMASKKRGSTRTNPKQRVNEFVHPLNRSICSFNESVLCGFIVLVVTFCSRRFMDLWESGLARFWVKSVTPRADECLDTNRKKKTARQVPIRLVDLTSAFLILGIGLGSAIICLMLERIQSKLNSIRNTMLAAPIEINQEKKL